MISIPELYKIFLKNPAITTDTRAISEGSLFFALKGEKFNGNSFANAAIQSGAAFAVIDEKQFESGPQTILVDDVLSTLQALARHHRRQLNIPFIGITGTNGKTTSKELINSVLSKKYNVLATKGNLNNHIGVPLTVLSVTSKHTMAVIEMGANHVGEIEFLCNIADPKYGLITNIGKAHLEGFGGVQGVIKAKSELYRHLREYGGLVFLNGGNDLLVDLSHGMEKVTYGVQSNFNVSGKVNDTSDYLSLSIKIKGDEFDVHTQLTGNYNAENVLAACAIGNYFGVTNEQIKKAIESYAPSNNRSQIIKRNGITIISDAYNANPSSMTLAIENLSAMKAKTKLAIVGDMLELGKESDSEHAKVTEMLNRLNIPAVFVGPEFSKVAKGNTTFKTAVEASEHVKKLKLTDALILVKGSRGIQLEKVIDVL